MYIFMKVLSALKQADREITSNKRGLILLTGMIGDDKVHCSKYPSLVLMDVKEMNWDTISYLTFYNSVLPGICWGSIKCRKTKGMESGTPGSMVLYQFASFLIALSLGSSST